MTDLSTKITFLIDSMQSRGGMERVTATVASGLAERGFQVQILTLRGHTSAFPLTQGIELRTLDLPPGSLRMRSETWPLIRRLRQHFVQQRPDILIVVDTFLSVFAYPATLGMKMQRVAWEHFNFQTDLGMRSRRLGRWAAAFLGQQIVTLTFQDAEHWVRAFPRAPARIRAIANPLSFPLLPTNPYSPDATTVLAVGRLDRQKGFDLLLQAWARIEADVPGWTLRILGNGDQEQALRALGAEFGLTRWGLAPATSQIEQEYRAAGIYALSSRHEGLPMVLMESQAYGIPAVAFNCPTGPADLLGPGGGLLVDAGQVQAFAEALKHLIFTPEARTRLSTEAYQNSTRYESGQILDQWATFILTLGSVIAPSRSSGQRSSVSS